jgi:hypothetical protein
MKDNIFVGVDIYKLKNRLKEIEINAKNVPPIDPCRGLSGELLRKMLAGLAGHRSGVLTEKENEEIEKIQLSYDRLHS